MLRQSKVTESGYSPSVKDQVLGIVFVVSALLCFGLSFTLFQPNGRPFLFISCFLFCLICLTLSENKKGIGLAFVGFLAIRMLWAVIVRGFQL